MLNIPGGNLLYAATGTRLWDASIGLIARVGDDYPHEWLRTFEKKGYDTRGIRILAEDLDTREFLAYTDPYTRSTSNPISHFARLEIPFPKALFGYEDHRQQFERQPQRTARSIRPEDIPTDFKHTTTAHFCGMDYLSHSLLPAILRQDGFTMLTLSPSPGYMTPVFWDKIPSVLTGLDAVLTSEEHLRALFQGRSVNLNEMVETIAGYGIRAVVVKRGLKGQLLYETDTKTFWDIPAYASREVDTTGAGDAFCGGFLAGLRKTFDPVEAVLYGNVSASFTIEGSGPFYALDTLPGLPEARLNALRQSVRKL